MMLAEYMSRARRALNEWAARWMDDDFSYPMTIGDVYSTLVLHPKLMACLSGALSLYPQAADSPPEIFYPLLVVPVAIGVLAVDDLRKEEQAGSPTTASRPL